MIRRQLTRHDRPDTSLVVDLSAVELIDSCGLGLLVTLSNSAAISNRVLALVFVEDRLADILRIAGLADAFVRAATVTDACSAIARPPSTP